MPFKITSIEKRAVIVKSGLYFRIDEIISERADGTTKFRCGAMQKGRGRWHTISPKIILEVKL
jgi:hypothetical protein